MNAISLAGIILLFLCAATMGSESERPNVIVFLVDDLGWRDLQCYGSRFHETPHADALASEAVRFTQAYSACHVCSPTRASIMTGKYPARLHLTDWLPGRKDFPFQALRTPSTQPHLPLQEVTLAEALKAHGYRTAHIGKWHLGEEPFGPTAQGFDLQVPRWNKGWPNTGFHSPFKLDGLDDKPGEYLTDRLTDVALSFMEANRESPFFLYMSHFAVHDPIEGRNDLVDRYQQKLASMKARDGLPFVLEGNPDDRPALSKDRLDNMISQVEWSGFKILPQRTVKVKQHQDNVQFAAMVSTMDESLGRIVARLKQLQLYDKTIIMFMSDNGGMSAANFGNPSRVVPERQLDKAFSTSNLPLRGAKGWLYEGGIRVPMIIRMPGSSANGSVCDVPVISNDIYPTVLELAGLPARPDQHHDGVSLAKLVQDRNQSLDRTTLYWHFPHYSNHGMQSPCAAIRAGDYKLIEYFENGTMQLFDLTNDLSEQHDLAALQPLKAAELREQLHQWQAEVGAQMIAR